MRKLILIITSAMALAFVPAASASSISECGDYWAWLNVGTPGMAKVVTNITTRHVSCSDARSFVDKLWHRGMPAKSGWIRLAGWHPYWGTYRTFNHGWQADLRATRMNGYKVIRFQYWTDYC